MTPATETRPPRYWPSMNALDAPSACSPRCEARSA